MKTVLSVVMSFAIVMLFGVSQGWAQQKAGDSAKQIVGTWKVVSYKAQTVGQENWREPIGANPKGYVIFTDGGRMMLLLTASGRKPPTNDAERAALLNSMLAYSGKYSIEKDQMTIMVDTSWSEAHFGDRQKQMRFIKIEGNKLTLRTPPQIGTRSSTAGAAPTKSITEIVWEREK